MIEGIIHSGFNFIDPSSWLPLTTFNVTAEVDLIWELRDVHFESVLDLVEDLGVTLVRHEGDCETLGSKSSSPGHSVEVGVSVLGHVVVENNIDPLDVHATPEEVGGHEDPLLEILELLISGESLLLSHPSVYGNSWEILFYQQLRQGHTSLHRLDEDDDLNIET